MAKVRLTHIDGKLPNLALMKLAAYWRGRGADIHFTKSVERDMLEPEYDHVYGSAIFSFSVDRVRRFREQFPGAIVGGTHDMSNVQTVAEHLGIDDVEAYDYSIYPGFDASIGFTQRGCRLKCGFCVVPRKEGKPRSVNTIASLWRGEPYPRHLHVLDNDFFGQPRDQWEARIGEMIDGGFKVCLNQGINIRLIDDESAKAIASIKHYNDSFTERIVYAAWDNIGDEARFFRGVDLLEKHGVPPFRLRVYMLVGYDKRETWERVLYRFDKMVARQIRPYPMIYGDRQRSLPVGGAHPRLAKRTLADFQRWVIRRGYAVVPLEAYDVNAKGRKDTRQGDMLEVA